GFFDGVAEGGAGVGDGDADGTAGSGSSRGVPVTSGRASSEPRPSPTAWIMPVAVPIATTTEAAATMAPRPAARLRAARRPDRRWAREPATVLLPLPRGGRVPPFRGSVGPAATAPTLNVRLCAHAGVRTSPDVGGHGHRPDACRRRRPARAGRDRGLQPCLPRRHRVGGPAHRRWPVRRRAGGDRPGRAGRAALPGRPRPGAGRPPAAGLLAAPVPVPPSSRGTPAAVRAGGHQRAHRPRPGARRGGHLPYPRLRTGAPGGRLRPGGRPPRLVGGADPRGADAGP